MIRKLMVTDLTRMQRGFVCVAALDPEGHTIRLATPRFHEGRLIQNSQAAVYPSALIECELGAPMPDPPHTEDHGYDPDSLTHLGRLGSDEWKRRLSRTLFPTVQAIFEQDITAGEGYYILNGQGPRSLGSIQPAAIHEVRYAVDRNRKWDYRLGFYDASDTYYRLKITDLTWHRYCDSLRGPDSEPRDIAAHLTQQLKALRRSGGVFLRIGLSRGWSEHPDRCYLQINGVYTFPDYLDGRTHADL